MCPLVCRIGQVPLYLPVPTLLYCCHIYLPVPNQDLLFYIAATYICLSQARAYTSILLPHIFACSKPGPTLQQYRSVGTGKYSGTCPIRHTKGPGKCVGLYRISEYSGFILAKRNTLGP
jgi:hypothetical protein